MIKGLVKKHEFDNELVDDNQDLKRMVKKAVNLNMLANKNKNTIVALISVTGDKVPVIVGCSKDVGIDAREIIKHLINQSGGSGGGRSDFAQGGLENTENLEIALASVADLIVSLNNQ